MAKKTTRSKTDASKMLAVAAAQIAQDNNTEEIVVLDVRESSPVTNYFVIGTGSSGRQMRTVAEDIIEYGEAIGQPVARVAGLEGGDWIVLDFFDVMIHLFDEAHRRYYDLELIWGEAPRVAWKRYARRTDNGKNKKL